MNEFENNNMNTYNHDTEDADYEIDGSQVEETDSEPNYFDQTYNDSAYRTSSNKQSSYNSSHIPSEPDKAERKKKSKSGAKWFGKVVASALVFGLVSGGTMAGVSIAKDQLYTSKAQQISVTTAPSDSDSSSSGTGSVKVQDVSSIVNQVMPSVVSITCTMTQTSVFGTQQSSGAGSGFILAKTDEKLFIATNNHVVSGATSLTVGFSDGTTADAEIVGTDSDSDLGVISVSLDKISDDTAKTIKIATLGSSDALNVGDSVIAIGNALGYGQSVTTGVVSAKNREVSFTDGTMTLLQTDAAINPGNSGGVLINMKGEVIGINNAKLSDTSVEGMGYAIPISTAQSVLTDLMNSTSIKAGEEAFLGIVGRTIDSSYSQALGIPTGVYITQITAGSPAEKAGLAAGDVVTSFDGNNISTMDGLKSKIALKKQGTKVTLTIKRANQNGEYEEQTVEVTLGKKSDFADETSSDNSNNSQNNNQSNGQGNNGSSNDNSNGYYYYYNNGNGNSGNDSYSPFEYFFGSGNYR